MDQQQPSQTIASLIRTIERRGEFVSGEDGYVYYWPASNAGALGAWALRAIAEELDRRNAAWDETVKADLAAVGR